MTALVLESSKTRRRRNSVDTWAWMDIAVSTRFHLLFNLERSLGLLDDICGIKRC